MEKDFTLKEVKYELKSLEIWKKIETLAAKFISGRVPGTRCKISAGALAPVALILEPPLY